MDTVRKGPVSYLPSRKNKRNPQVDLEDLMVAPSSGCLERRTQSSFYAKVPQWNNACMVQLNRRVWAGPMVVDYQNSTKVSVVKQKDLCQSVQGSVQGFSTAMLKKCKCLLTGVSNLLASLSHTGRVVLVHPLNTLWQVITKEML